MDIFIKHDDNSPDAVSGGTCSNTHCKTKATCIAAKDGNATCVATGTGNASTWTAGKPIADICQ